MRAGGAGGAGGDVWSPGSPLGPSHLAEPLGDRASMSQRMQERATQENKLIMSTRAGASLNKSPREAELLDQWDVSGTELSYMMDGLINHVFAILSKAKFKKWPLVGPCIFYCSLLL